MIDNIARRLAQSLEVNPEDIMSFTAVGEGMYTVLLTNYKKFRDVIPAPQPKPKPKSVRLPSTRRPTKQRSKSAE